MRKRSLALSAALALIGCQGEPAPPPPATPSSQGPATAPAPLPATPQADGLVGGHPRIWITAEDLPRLRSLVNAKNPVWEKGLKLALAQAIATYDKDFFPGGQPNPSWPDPGIDNWVGKCTEAYAELFAFMSLVDPDAAARPAHAERAKKLLMHVIDEAVKGPDPNRQSPAPFRGPSFATYNRASYWGEAFGVIVDWIYPSLSAADKASIRKVFMRWSDENTRAATSGNEHPQPIGLLNDKRLVADKKRLRWAANNYFTGHMRQLTLMGLAFDEADDPPVDAGAPRGKFGNTLQSYLEDSLGAWLYQQYAVYEDPGVAAAALGVPPDGLGAASGGLSPEGFLYGPSIGMLHQALLALHTAGYRDSRKHGAQLALMDSAYWDRYADGLLHSLTPVPETHGHSGPIYQMFNFGDTLRFWIIPEHVTGFASIAAHAMRTGNAARLAKAQWIVVNAVEGGAGGVPRRVGNIWGNSSVTQAILQFMVLDPAATPPADPRSKLPLVFHDKALGRVIARTAWTPEATVFDYKCGWSTIGHQLGDCNQIELYRKGEWLTKERSGFANDLQAMAPENHNTLAIQGATDKPRDLQWFEGVILEKGGQWSLSSNGGDPKVLISQAPGWVFAQGDATPLYNRVTGGREATDVAHASRSVAWLAPDQVVIYDRAASRGEGRFKRFNLTFVGEPAVSGALTTVTTPKGQKLFVHTLAPAGAAITGSKVANFNLVAEGEPTKFRLVVEDTKNPREARFLHVLEGADASATPSPVQVVKSRSGTPFTGAAVGSLAVLFPVDLATPVERVTYVVPASTKGQLVTGLSPGASYDVAIKTAGGSIEVSIGPGSGRRADDAGVIALGSLEGKAAP